MLVARGLLISSSLLFPSKPDATSKVAVVLANEIGALPNEMPVVVVEAVVVDGAVVVVVVVAVVVVVVEVVAVAVVVTAEVPNENPVVEPKLGVREKVEVNEVGFVSMSDVKLEVVVVLVRSEENVLARLGMLPKEKVPELGFESEIVVVVHAFEVPKKEVEEEEEVLVVVVLLPKPNDDCLESLKEEKRSPDLGKVRAEVVPVPKAEVAEATRLVVLEDRVGVRSTANLGMVLDRSADGLMEAAGVTSENISGLVVAVVGVEIVEAGLAGFGFSGTGVGTNTCGCCCCCC